MSVRIPTTCGRITIEARDLAGTAETCSYWRNTDDPTDEQVYRHRKTTYHYSGGTYFEEWTYSGELIINGIGECPDAIFNTDFDPGTDYGTETSPPTNVFDDAVTPSAVLSAATGHQIAGSWSTPVVYTASNKAGVFAALDDIHDTYGAAVQHGPVLNDAPLGTWQIVANSTKSEIRVRLALPLAVTVYYDIGTRADEAEDYTYGDAASFVLTVESPEHVVTVTPETDATKVFRLVNLVYLPLT